MKGMWLHGLVAFLAVSSLAGRNADRSVPQSLTPFSEIERLFVRGAVIVCAVVAIWFLTVLIRGKLEDRRQARRNRDPAHPQVSRPTPTRDQAESPPPQA